MEPCEATKLGRTAQPDPRNLLSRIQVLEEQVQKTQQRCDDLETELIREKWHRQELQWQLQENHQSEVDSLKEQMESLSFQTTSGMEAVSGQLSAVSSLLRTALASKVCEPHKKSALECLHCAMRNSVSLAAFIIEQSQQVDVMLQSCNENNEAPLLVAVESGDLEIVKLLVKHSSPFTLGIIALETRQNGLHYAAACGHTEIVKYLLELKRVPSFDVNALDDERQTPLFLACRGGHLEAAKVLVEKGASFSIKRSDGCTAIHAASFYGHYKVVEWLLQQQQHKDTGVAVDFEGNSALHYAALGGHIPLMEMLVKHGLSLARTNVFGQTPLAMAGVPQSSGLHLKNR